MDAKRVNPRLSFLYGLIAWILVVGTIGALLGLFVPSSHWENALNALMLLAAWLAGPILLTAGVVRGMRGRRAGLVLSHIEQAVRLNLPLAQAIGVSADSESWRVRARLRALQYRLESGENLALAVYRAVPELPKSTPRAIEAAEAIGRLPQMLHRLVGRATPRERPGSGIDRFYRDYAVLLTVMMVSIFFGLIAIIVLPKFQDILRSFNLPLHWTTRLLMEVSDSWIPFAIIGAMLLIFCFPWRRWVIDHLIGYVPIAGGAARDCGMADLCAFLTDAVEAGQPMDAAASQAAQAQPNATLRRRIGKWARRMTAGQLPYEAAGDAGLPSLFVGMLSTVRSGEDFLQVMSFLSRYYESRFSKAREMIRAAAIPAFVLVTGAAVLFVDLAVFQPMISMIDHLALPLHGIGGF